LFSGKRLRYGVALFPLAALLLAAFLLGSAQREAARREYLTDHVRHAARSLDFRLGRLLDLTAFCAGSPALVRDLDFRTFEESCGVFAAQLGAWVVVVETGETHRQIVNTRADAPVDLPVYPRTDEVPSLLAIEEKSRANGVPGIAEVFPGLVHQGGVVTAGQAVDLPDGRRAMVYVGTTAESLSTDLAALKGEDIIFTLVDSTQQVVARSEDIDAYLFSDASALMRMVSDGEALFREEGQLATGIVGDTAYRSLDAVPGWTLFAVSTVPIASLTQTLFLSPSSLILLGMILSGGMWLMVRAEYRLAERLGDAERARSEAERANREKSRLLASFAHDIRNPLISLIGSLELSDIDSASRARHIESGRTAAEALLQLVDDILELSHMGAGEFTLHPSPVDLHRLAEDVVEQAITGAREKGLELTLEVADGLPHALEVDRLRLQQVLGNLVANAVKYTDLGTVTLRITAQDRSDGQLETLFEIIDTGVGLRSEDIPRILREFGQLDREKAERQSGVGLGLAICQRILSKMGSRLEVESRPDEGSTFSFRLALPVAANGHLEMAIEPMEGLVIVYAEDEPVIRQVTANRLRAAGAKVIEAIDGTDALAKLETVTPDLLLLDLQMPGEDGVETIRRLHTVNPAPSYPIFVLTSYIAGPRASEARAAGADAVFTKPGQVVAIAAALRARRGDAGRHTPELTPPIPASDAPFVDLENFLAVMEATGDKFESQVLDRFEESLRADIEQLDTAITLDDIAKVEALAHKALGLCSVVGATLLAYQLRKLEQAVETGDLVVLPELTHSLGALAEETIRQMRDVVQNTRKP
jgi:signal transduction histidine kinase/CheY-like chemotaxis protein/HPt (histidine-containing phosphotransfer) domain-containing protein